MKFSFSTLACPAWSLDTVLDAAARLGFQGIELRFIENDDQLWRRPEFSGSGLKEAALPHFINWMRAALEE